MKERIAAAFVCMLLSAAGAGAQQSGAGSTGPGTATTPAATASPSHDAQATASVQARPEASQPAAKASHKVPPGSALDTTRTCRVHGQRTMEFIDQMTADVQRARMTRDPAQTRAALDRMQATLSQMKQHLSICMERLAEAH